MRIIIVLLTLSFFAPVTMNEGNSSELHFVGNQTMYPEWRSLHLKNNMIWNTNGNVHINQNQMNRNNVIAEHVGSTGNDEKQGMKKRMNNYKDSSESERNKLQNIENSSKEDLNTGGDQRSAHRKGQNNTTTADYRNVYFIQDLFEENDPEDPNVCKTPSKMTLLALQFNNVFSSDRRDMFRCSKNCMCKYLNKNTHTVANCKNRGLDNIPGDLPNNIVYLDISENYIPRISFNVLYKYKFLREFHATDCHIQSISKPFSRLSKSLETLDLRYNSITKLDSQIFIGFKYLRVLLLTGNKIYYIQQDLFLGLENLHFLDLTLNNISTIDVSSFEGLTHLEKLSLSGNRYLGYKILTYDLFKSLKHLKVLKIQGCSNGDVEYPNEAIAALQNLEDLNIDALADPAEFKSQFATLRNLKTLRFGPYADCRLVNMTDTFFQYFTKLTCLYFHSCNTAINYKAYGSFKKLKSLSIEKVPSVTLDEAFFHLSGFKTKSLRHIGFKNLTNWNWPCIWLTKVQGGNMTRFNLTSIDLSGNRLSLLSDSFINAIPKSVEKLILKDNKFTLINTFWMTLENLTNLHYIDVSFQNVESHSHYIPILADQQFRNSFYTLNSENVYSAMDSYTNYALKTNPQVKEKERTENFHSKEVMHIPKNLQIVKAAWYHLFGNALLTNRISNNSLRFLNFSASGLRLWGRGRLPKNVEILDVSKNDATFIHQDFFHPNSSLLQLHIDLNLLGDFIYHSNNSIFRNLKNLRFLNLSANSLFKIPFDFFNDLNHIETIILTNNRIETLNISFKNTPHLNFIDLHGNSLSWITEITRNDLDNLKGVVIDLHYNSFVCDCDTIDIIHWMSITRVYFLNINLYTCYDRKGYVVGIGSRDVMKQRVDYLRRVCFSTGYLIFGSIAFALIFVISISAGITYRNRWWIRYKKHVLIAKWFGFKPQDQSNQENYKYDAFLLYVNADRRFAIKCSKQLEKERHHKLCIGDRDIIPGTSELAAIVSFVQNSRFTLVAITDNFLTEMNSQFRDAPMIEHALQMALMEEYCTKRKTLHLMVCSREDNVKYPPYILKIFCDQCMTFFPSDEAQDMSSAMINSFWDKLSATIGHAERCVDERDNSIEDCYFFNAYPYRNTD